MAICRGGRGLAVALPVVGPQEIGAELVEARAPDLAHHEVDLASEDVDGFLDPGDATGSRAVKGRPAHEAEIGAEAERDQDVGAAAHAAVQKDRHFVAYRRLDLRQHVERARRLIELAPAVVGDEDAVATYVYGAQRVLRVHDAFDNERT